MSRHDYVAGAESQQTFRQVQTAGSARLQFTCNIGRMLHSLTSSSVVVASVNCMDIYVNCEEERFVRGEPL